MKKLVSFIVGMLAVNCFAIAAPMYQKINETEFKSVEAVTENKEKVYSITTLLQDKARLLTEIRARKNEYAKQIKEVEDKLTEIEMLIVKAQELGIVAY